ncbi:uncharacterized protein [Battus philenor]|uniref:uncharacterized protein n=1 Tax=Battus philenor TaxID=42288 RepID=UPI0035D03386
MVSADFYKLYACRRDLEEKPVKIREGPLSEIDSHLELKNIWKHAKPPNYDQHVNKFYPYSELPYAGEYTLLKIPISLRNLIKHVDYWGEGRIITPQGTSGFTDCYNVNEKYQLVSRGGNVDRKIPNRIPVLSATDCDTSKYIKDKSVELVTISGKAISPSCAQDVARIVNNDIGKVVALGYDRDSEDILNLEAALKRENLLFYATAELPAELNELTAFDTRIVYVGLDNLKHELLLNVSDGNYDSAIQIIKDLEMNGQTSLIRNVVTKMVKEAHRNVLKYAYQLWINGEQEFVKKYFPAAFASIASGGSVKIIHKKDNLSLKLGDVLDAGESRKALADVADARSAWKLVPIWEYKDLVFKIESVDHKLFLRLGDKKNNRRQAYGEPNSDELSYKWSLQPVSYKSELLFYIINKQFKQGLKVDGEAAPAAGRLVVADDKPVCESDVYSWDLVPTS